MKSSPPLWTVNIIALILGIWPYVIVIKGLSEVEKYSVWKALGNVVISFIGVVIILVSLYILIASTF